MAAPAWTRTAQRIVLPLAGLDLTLQYIAGLMTNAYAPAAGFTQNTDFGWYDLHWTNGYVLGILMIITLVVVGLSRNYRNLAAAAIAFVAVVVAAFAGMAFVNTTPNPPTATAVMGLAFLVAFAALMALSFRAMATRERPPPTPVEPARATPG
jgi:hypothetical protein